MKKSDIVETKGKDTFLCELADFEDLSSKSYTVTIKHQSTRIFLVRKGLNIFAYINICPHAQAPLEWNPDDFLDVNRENIICAMHGAKFSIENGQCVEGPCNGAGLTPVNLFVESGMIYLSDH